MASERSYVIDKLQKLSSTLESHVLKLGIYDDNLNCKDHWIDEVANFLSIANDFTVKPKNKKLDKREYEKYLIGGLGDTRKDAFINIRMFKLSNNKDKEYPDFEITDEMIDRTFNISKLIADFVLGTVSSKNTLEKRDIYYYLKERL